MPVQPTIFQIAPDALNGRTIKRVLIGFYAMILELDNGKDLQIKDAWEFYEKDKLLDFEIGSSFIKHDSLKQLASLFIHDVTRADGRVTLHLSGDKRFVCWPPGPRPADEDEQDENPDWIKML